MKSTTLAQIASSLDLPQPLAPFAAQLMHGIDSLGSYPSHTTALCKKLGMRAKSSVLDLACGKGSIAIELAALGWSVTGVDASPDFIHRAEILAKTRGVRPKFFTADVHAFATRKKFDMVVMLNLFPIEEAADFCRRFVRPGGIMIIDDATLAPDSKSARWLSRDEVKAILEEEGDKVLAIRQVPTATISRAAIAIEKVVAANGRTLQKAHPMLRGEITAYVKRLKRSRTLLTTTLRPTLFALRVPVA